MPPRGIFIPTSLIYDVSLPPAVCHTWIQLRGLALNCQETPPLTFAQLSEILHKKRSTLYAHLRLLQSRGVLRWRPGGKAEIIVVFPRDEEFWESGSSENLNPLDSIPENPEGIFSAVQDSGSSQKLNPPDSNLENPPEILTAVPESRFSHVRESGFSVKFKSLNPPDLNLKNPQGKFNATRESGNPDSAKGPPSAVPKAVLKPFVDTLAEVTGMQADLNYPRLARSARKLVKSGYSAEQVASLYSLNPSGGKTAWYARDWRGRKGQRPTPEQIEQTILVLSAPASDPSTLGLLRRLAEREGIDIDDL